MVQHEGVLKVDSELMVQDEGIFKVDSELCEQIRPSG